MEQPSGSLTLIPNGDIDDPHLLIQKPTEQAHLENLDITDEVQIFDNDLAKST